MRAVYGRVIPTEPHLALSLLAPVVVWSYHGRIGPQICGYRCGSTRSLSAMPPSKIVVPPKPAGWLLAEGHSALSIPSAPLPEARLRGLRAYIHTTRGMLQLQV